eukprot:6474796-Amphidinium_carterae.2
MVQTPSVPTAMSLLDISANKRAVLSQAFTLVPCQGWAGRHQTGYGKAAAKSSGMSCVLIWDSLRGCYGVGSYLLDSDSILRNTSDACSWIFWAGDEPGESSRHTKTTAFWTKLHFEFCPVVFQAGTQKG